MYRTPPWVTFPAQGLPRAKPFPVPRDAPGGHPPRSRATGITQSPAKQPRSDSTVARPVAHSVVRACPRLPMTFQSPGKLRSPSLPSYRAHNREHYSHLESRPVPQQRSQSRHGTTDATVWPHMTSCPSLVSRRAFQLQPNSKITASGEEDGIGQVSAAPTFSSHLKDPRAQNAPRTAVLSHAAPHQHRTKEDTAA